MVGGVGIEPTAPTMSKSDNLCLSEIPIFPTAIAVQQPPLAPFPSTPKPPCPGRDTVTIYQTSGLGRGHKVHENY